MFENIKIIVRINYIKQLFSKMTRKNNRFNYINILEILLEIYLIWIILFGYYYVCKTFTNKLPIKHFEIHFIWLHILHIYILTKCWNEIDSWIIGIKYKFFRYLIHWIPWERKYFVLFCTKDLKNKRKEIVILYLYSMHHFIFIQF